MKTSSLSFRRVRASGVRSNELRSGESALSCPVRSTDARSSRHALVGLALVRLALETGHEIYMKLLPEIHPINESN